MKNKLTTALVEKMNEVLDNMKKNPDSVTEHDRELLSNLYSKICKSLGISEHSRWEVQWRVEKWLDSARHLAGFAPDEVVCEGQNIILDVGAEEMLKLITGTGGTQYSNANAYIYVGDNSTAEQANQSGVLATTNRASARMDAGYPSVDGRQMVFRASFGESVANFNWNEVAVSNGNGVGAIAMNRKVANLGTKTTGTWSVQVTVSLVSA